MNRTFHPFAALLVLMGSALLALAADTAPVKVPQPERWLVIVDTSSAMERRGKAVEGMVGELLASGMRGEMKPGSEIGLWTYNKEVFSGQVPLQIWNPAQSNLIAGRTVNYLATQKFRDKSRLPLALDQVQAVVAESRRLTVLVFTDASATFTNTPFDEALNAAVAANKASLAQTRMPLVAVLRSEKGKYIGQTVSMAPWPVEFPPFPPEPTPVVKPEAPATNNPPREIHISAKPKPEPVVIPAPVVPPPVTNPPPTVVAVVEPAPAIPPSTGSVATVTTQSSVAPPPVTPPPTPAPAPAPVAPPVVKPSAPTPPPAAVSAPAAPETKPARSHWPLYAGIGFMTAAALIALILVLRSRRPRGSSLITRSFDRE